MKLELVPVPVSDVDRAKAFYVERLGFVADVDVSPAEGVRVVQLTPPGSACSIGMGVGLPVYQGEPGTIRGLHLVVADLDTTRAELGERGVEVGETIDVGGGVRYAGIVDPDGNTLLLQEMAWRAGRAPVATEQQRRPLPRVDRASRVIAAEQRTVYGALVDRPALEAWLPPEGMSGRIDRWDPRADGGFRMVLTYLDPNVSAGKSSDNTDVVEVGFAALEPPHRVIQRATFESDDPEYAGTMTMTWQLTATQQGTSVTVTATDVPPGIDQTAHEAGIASSLANLAQYVES